MTQKIPVKHIDPGDSSPKDKPKTVELYASRKKIYVKEIKGLFQRIRTFSLWGLMGMYFVFCWISIDGQQLIHFDLPARKFHLFGITFWPQDFMLLSWSLIICAFGLFFITTLFGRVWCGYTCPQTVWTFIFMWLEERIEGSRNQRMKLDKAPMSAEKALRKTGKHAAWLLVAFGTGLTFVGYFYPIRDLIPDLLTLEANGWSYFWTFFFTTATYLNAGWMREQVCLYMCPYARFQSVMFDRDTRVVAYNTHRGEPRGSRKREADPKTLNLGDCIDCGQCVQVCPTGIDIRDGLQYECIGCALCIDACDDIMEKMGYAPGLISYTTENQLEGRTSHILRPRTFGYGAVLCAMIGLVAYTIITRVPAALDVLRDRGAMFQMTGQGWVENSYTVKVLNMAEQPRVFNISVEGLEGIRIVGKTDVSVNSGEVLSVPLVVEVEPEHLPSTNNEIRFRLVAADDPNVNRQADSRFIGPAGYR